MTFSFLLSYARARREIVWNSSRGRTRCVWRDDDKCCCERTTRRRNVRLSCRRSGADLHRQLEAKFSVNSWCPRVRRRHSNFTGITHSLFYRASDAVLFLIQHTVRQRIATRRAFGTQRMQCFFRVVRPLFSENKSKEYIHVTFSVTTRTGRFIVPVR